MDATSDNSQRLHMLPKQLPSDSDSLKTKRLSLGDSINAEVLDVVKTIFDAADADGGGFLDVDEFVNAFNGILSTKDGSHAGALKKLFSRIDANSDGTIDWNEFISFMLLDKGSNATNHQDRKQQFIECPVRSTRGDKQMHKSNITSICKVPHRSSHLYVTTSKDGSLGIWNADDLSYERTVQCGQCWMTDAAMLSVTKAIAVTDFTRSITLYDIPTLNVIGVIRDLSYAPVCLTICRGIKSRESEYICIGDIAGQISLYEVFSAGIVKKGHDRFNHRLIWTNKLHRDVVTSVRFVEELESVVTTSTDGVVSISDIHRRLPPKKLIGHNRGVNTCDWSSFYKFLCSGGQDRSIIIWNPFSQKPLATLQGHSAPVTCVVVHDPGNRFLSLSYDKCIKIWDIRSHTCLQTLHDNESYHPDNTLTAMIFDPDRSRIVCGNKRIKGWEVENTNQSRDPYHEGTIVDILYNTAFDEAVSADSHGNICVWDLKTCELRSRFIRIVGDHVLTSIAFDAHQRRLLTTTDSGICHVWNVSVGTLLKTVVVESGMEMCDAVCMEVERSKYILTAGWDRRVHLFNDDTKGGDGHVERSLSGHEADIVALSVTDDARLIASGDDEGVIFIWNSIEWTRKMRCIPGLKSPLVDIEFLHGKYGDDGHIPSFGIEWSRSSHMNDLASLYDDGHLRLWSAIGGQMMAEYIFRAQPIDMTISRHQTASIQLAIAIEGGLIEVVWLKDNEDRTTIFVKAHALSVDAIGSIASIEWTPDIDQILVATEDLRLGLWSIEKGCIRALGRDMTHEADPIEPVAF